MRSALADTLSHLRGQAFQKAADLVMLYGQQRFHRGQGRLIKLLNKVEPYVDRPVTAERNGNRFVLDPSRRGMVTRAILYQGVWEPQSTRWVLANVRAGWRCFDVGANIGYYTVLLGRAVGPAGEVIAFEPVSAFFQSVSNQIRANELSNVRAENMALSDVETTLTFYVTHDTAANDPQHWSRSRGRAEEVRCTTLDAYTERNPGPVHFAKIDLDGHEPRFFKGAQRTLRDHKPLLLLEVVPEGLAGGAETARSLIGDLAKLGYTFSTTGGRVLAGDPSAVLNGLLADALDSSNLVCRAGAN